MKKLTPTILTHCGASKKAHLYVPALNELLPYYQVDTHLRLSHFLSQILHESDRMRTAEEYASGEAYEGRLDLGNTQRGDGKRYKGRGLIQTTGRTNYTAFARKFGIDCVNHPQLLAEPRWAVASALYYWGTRALNKLADEDEGKKITKRINGGYNGLEDRLMLLERCKHNLLPLFT